MDDQRRISGVQRVTVGARIRFERQRKGWKQDELARESGLTVDDVARFESGQATPTEADLTQISTALGMTPEALCREPAGSATRRGVG